MMHPERPREAPLFRIGIYPLLVSYLLPDLVNEGIPSLCGFAPKHGSDSQDIRPPQQSVLPDAQETHDVVVSSGGQGKIPTDDLTAWKAIGLVEKSVPGKVVHYSYRLRSGDFNGMRQFRGPFSGKQRDAAPRPVTPTLQKQQETRGIVSDGSDESTRPFREQRSIRLIFAFSFGAC